MQQEQEVVTPEFETEEAYADQSNDTVDEVSSEDGETFEDAQEAGESEGELEESSEAETITDVLSNPNYSKGEKKRIAKLLQEKHDLLQQLADARSSKNEFEGHNRVPAQTNHQQQQQYTPDTRLDPTSPNFDFALYTKELVRQQLDQERQIENQKRQAESVLSDYQKVEQSLQRARVNDPNFAQQWEKYGNLLTPDMKYVLAELDRPDLFLKHIFKNEKDVRALQELGKKHPSEQVRRLTVKAISFDRDNRGRGSAPSTPQRPKPIPQLGKRGAVSSFANGYNEQTGTWDQSVIDKMLS